MTFIIVLLFLFILVVPVFGNKIIEMVEYVNLNESITKTIVFSFNLMKGPVAWFIIFCFIKILYTMAPDRKIPSSYVNYGAIFTTIMWVIVTAIYSYYINNFANYTIFYGGLANIVMLMLWIYLLATIFVIGMALNYKEEVIKLEKTGSINLDIK
jgi:membrane protein